MEGRTRPSLLLFKPVSDLRMPDTRSGEIKAGTEKHRDCFEIHSFRFGCIMYT